MASNQNGARRVENGNQAWVAQPQEELQRFTDLLLLRNPDTFSEQTREVATPLAEKCRGYPVIRFAGL